MILNSMLIMLIMMFGVFNNGRHAVNDQASCHTDYVKDYACSSEKRTQFPRRHLQEVVINQRD